MTDDNRIKLTNLISKLSTEDVALLSDITRDLFPKYFQPERPACPYCSGIRVVKNGHKCGKQEYLCKCCGRTFVSTTNTLMANSRQPREIWEEVIADTFSGEAIDFTAKRLNLSHDCAFHMRHGILASLRTLQAEDGICLGDVSELDETFVLDSHKGKALPESVGRKARKHGAKAAKRGISDEYVCICTGVQRKGPAVAETVNRAKPSSEELREVFRNRIAEGTLILCDGLKSYASLEENTGCSVKNVNAEKGNGFHNLNTVNNFHSFIKNRYIFYRGVATKYLNRYNALFGMAYKYTKDTIVHICNKPLNVSSTNRCLTIRDLETKGLLTI